MKGVDILTTNITMNSDFLTKSRSSSLSSDKRSRTITWDCTPGKVYYNYVIPGGSVQRKGYYHNDGIYRKQSDGTYKKAGVRLGLFEGVKCVGITAGASAPESLVQGVLRYLEAHAGAQAAEVLEGVEENVAFPLPKGLWESDLAAAKR